MSKTDKYAPSWMATYIPQRLGENAQMRDMIGVIEGDAPWAQLTWGGTEWHAELTDGKATGTGQHRDLNEALCKALANYRRERTAVMEREAQGAA